MRAGAVSGGNVYKPLPSPPQQFLQHASSLSNSRATKLLQRTTHNCTLHTMKAYTALVSVCALVATGYAFRVTTRDTNTVCAGARALTTAPIAVGDKTVELTTFECGAARIHADDAAPPTSVAPALPLPTIDVCGLICNNVCGDSGSLPPVTEDCATIADAITILNGSISPSFTVAPGHAQTLAFGTCRIFFQNFSPFTLSNCWLSFSETANAAASACLPPVQPVNSEGICVAPDASWRIG
ncbi:hypothetical protein C8Q79DRAFT_915117 [Trametes meyenii]|nr:hypothetical protein C8Q79DRAFT_915117 [Trametes meyenii]